MMKTAIASVLGLLLLSSSAMSQRWSQYVLSVKGDTINTTDLKGLKQGRWVIRTESLRGEPGYEEEGAFVDDLKEGPWRRYNLTGDILAIENFLWGFRDGKQLYFSSLGDLIREEGWRAINPKNPYDTIEVPDLNNPMVSVQKIVKHEASELKHGAWKYYNPSSGLIIKNENFSYGQKIDALGRPIAGSSSSQQPMNNEKPKPAQKPAEVMEWERKNNGKKSIKVRDGRTGG
jgi:hypothetical protein